jgi:PAS domain S-box-containing protein
VKVDFSTLLLDESPDAVIATSGGGEVMYWSKGAEALFGYASAEALGRKIDDLIVPPDRIEEERRILHEALETGFSAYESVRRRKDGSPVYVDISSRAMRDTQG